MTGALTDRLAAPPASPDPSVWPLPEKEALLFAGPFAASAAAAMTAVLKAVALAPRTVSFTDDPFKMRKVGMAEMP